MAEETLLTAARRVVRFLRIDEADGGLLSLETVKAAFVLAKPVDAETARLKREAPNDAQIMARTEPPGPRQDDLRTDWRGAAEDEGSSET